MEGIVLASLELMLVGRLAPGQVPNERVHRHQVFWIIWALDDFLKLFFRL